MTDSEAPGATASLPPAVSEQLPDIETLATELAHGAGHLVSSLFGTSIQVDYKDKENRDPVTAADRQSQEYLVGAISNRFPDHGILGEEGEEEEGEEGVPDFLWVLDPLDGTTNYLNGLPMYAVSIGVLYRGLPVAGSLFIPWPRNEGGQVLHGSRGGGAYAGIERLTLGDSEGPVPNRLSGIPGSMGGQYRVAKPLRGKVGEVRVTGSIAYELAMVAMGVLQYAIIGGPRLWDVAAGALIVAESGGTVMLRRQPRAWQPMDTLVSTWEKAAPSMKELRRWVRPLIAGNAQTSPFVAANLKRRRRSLTSVARGWLRRMRPRSRPSGGAGHGEAGRGQ